MVSSDKIKELVGIIKKSCKPLKIILFGSYAKGSPGSHSDLDILVITESNLPRYERAREIRKHLWGKFDFKKDILVYTPKEVAEWENVSQSFINNVIKTGHIVYEK